MAEPAFARFARGLMDEEVTPTLTAHGLGDLEDYKSQLIERFRNPGLRHRTQQIAMDGTQKLPQRLLATIKERLEAGATIRRLALAVAAWMRYAAGVDEQGRVIVVRDPLAPKLATIAAAAGGDATKLVSEISSISPKCSLTNWPPTRAFARRSSRRLASSFEKGRERQSTNSSGCFLGTAESVASRCFSARG